MRLGRRRNPFLPWCLPQDFSIKLQISKQCAKSPNRLVLSSSDSINKHLESKTVLYFEVCGALAVICRRPDLEKSTKCKFCVSP